MCLLLNDVSGFAQDGKQSTVISPPEAEQWREDLRFMATEAPKWHNNLFHTITPAQFDGAIKRLHERIPDLARHEIIVERARIAAMVGDGHTNIAPTRDAKIGFRTLPVKLYLFKDGLFVRAATRENARLVGSQVVKIGSLTPEEAITLKTSGAAELVPPDTDLRG